MIRRRNQQGTATLWVLFTLIPIFAMVGLVTDVGWYYFTTEEATAAAESAALAAIQDAMDSVKSGGTYTCGSGTLACQATATACATSISSPPADNLKYGCAYAITNGFKNTGSQTVTIQAQTTSSPPTLPTVADALYWVTVRITQSNPLTFLGVFGGTTLGIGVRSTAAVIQTASPACVVALDPTANQAISISGGASVVASNCTVAVNSNSPDALDVSGGSSLTATTIDVVGTAQTNGGSTMTPSATKVSSVTNPYSSLAFPTIPSTCTYTNYTANGSTSPTPGSTFCGGITVSGGKSLSLSAGNYYLVGGGLNVSGGGTVNGSGVTFFNTCNPAPCSGGNNQYKALSFSASTGTLSAPTSGTYSGILYFQDPTLKKTGPQETVSGGASTCFTGVIYALNSPIVYSGGSSGSTCDTALVGNTVTFSGASNIGTTGSSGSGPSAPTAVLLE